MPSGEEIVAKRLFESIRDDLKTCNTEECRRAREENAALYQKVVVDHDTAALKKLDQLDADIVKLLEGIEKQINAPVEVGPCPHCGYDSDEKPKPVGRCIGSDHEVTYDEYDKKQGMKKCTICGEDIEWND